jgi:hypothetical protein
MVLAVGSNKFVASVFRAEFSHVWEEHTAPGTPSPYTSTRIQRAPWGGGEVIFRGATTRSIRETNRRTRRPGNNFVLWNVTQLLPKPAPNTVAVAFCAFTRVTDACTINQEWGKMYPDIATLVCCHLENSKWSNIPDSGGATFRTM